MTNETGPISGLVLSILTKGEESVPAQTRQSSPALQIKREINRHMTRLAVLEADRRRDRAGFARQLDTWRAEFRAINELSLAGSYLCGPA